MIHSLYTRVKNNAMLNHYHLSSNKTPNQESIDIAVNHLYDCMDYPTLGLLMRKSFENTALVGAYKKNLKFIKNSSNDYNAANEALDNYFDELYPNTKTARKFLINRNHVVLNCVKPTEKTFDKLIFKVKNNIKRAFKPIKKTVQRNIFHNCG